MTLLVFGISAISGSENQRPMSAPLIMRVVTGDVTVTNSLDGKVIASGDVYISPKISERISTILVKPGDQVRAGQLMATLDSHTESQALASAQSNYNNARAQLSNTQIQVDNQSATLKAQMVSLQTTLASQQSQLEATRTNQANNIPVFQTAVDQARENLQVAQAQNQIKALNYQSTVDTAANVLDKASRLASAYQGLISDTATVDSIAHSGVYGASGAGACTIFALIGNACTGPNIASSYNSYLGIMTDLKNANLAYETAKKTMQINLSSDQAQLVGLSNALKIALNSQVIGQARDEQSVQSVQQQISGTMAQINILQTQINYQPLIRDSSAVLVAKLSLENAQLNFNSTFVRSPVNGVIASVNNIVGQVPIGISHPTNGVDSAMIVITKVESLQFQASAIPSIGDQLKVGQNVTFTFSINSTVSKVGTINSISLIPPLYNTPAHYLVIFNFSTSAEDLYPGLVGTAAVATLGARNTLMVPNKAIMKSSNHFYYVMKKVLSNGSATFLKTQVQIGVQGDVSTQIISGLTANDEIEVKY